MPERRRRSWRLVAAAVAAVTVAGCAGIPTSGQVMVGRQIAAGGGLDDADIRVVPPAPLPSMSPADIVHGFLRALVNADGNYEIARSYLTHRAAATWNPSADVTTYDDAAVNVVTSRTDSARRTIRIAAPRVGLIDDRGDFTPQAGTVSARFDLLRQNGQWRIDRLGNGVLLSESDAPRSYRLADVYYLNRFGTTLVPEQLLLRPDLLGVATALVRALLNGPGAWLRPAVRSGFPAGTTLLGNVAIDAAGIAEVNVSAAVRRASPTQLATLSAQLVWTLKQVGGITGVRLLADGAPVSVHGAPVTQPQSAWATYSPSATPLQPDAFFRDNGRWRTIGPRPVHGVSSAAAYTDLAVAHDGVRFAAVGPGRGGVGLYVGSFGQRPVRRLVAQTLTRPTFDRPGNVYTVATRGLHRWVAQVTPTGVLHTVTVDPAVLRQPVQELRLSRDGARVAVVIGATGAGRLLVGRVTTASGQLRFSDFRDVLPRVADIRGLTWDGADQLVVTAADAGGGRELVAVDVDGYSTRAISTVGLTAEPDDVAAAPRRPLVVAAGRSIWVDDPAGGWRRVSRGSMPVYAD